MTDFMPKISSAKDWPETWKDLQTIDSLLRCSVCGEFFKDTTFIPSCSHNYCSLCIRRYICVESKCPICEVNVQDSQLENNRIIDEVVKCFVKIRDELLDVIKNSSSNIPEQQVKKDNELGKRVKKKDGDKSRFFTTKDKTTPSRTAKPSQKRHRKDSSASEKSSSNDRWSPVEKKKKMKRSMVQSDSSDSDEISIIEEFTPKKSPGAGRTSLARFGKNGKTQKKNEDLVDCPVCGQKIPNTRINFHLDTCLSGKERKDNLRSSQSPVKKDQERSEASSHVGANSFIPQVARRKPLNKLVYTLLSNTDLKRKMKEHGLSIKGDRQTLIKRHQEFTIVYNSECSKPKPKTVSEIVRLVEDGERKKNRPVENRDKLNFERTQNQEDIDKKKSEYLSQNQNEFTRLINEIKDRKKKAGKETASSDDNNNASTSKTEQGPSTSEEKFKKRILPSDDETASNSSGVDFEPVQKRFSTPRRQLRSSTVTEKRRSRSSAKIPEEIIEEVDEICRCSTTSDEGEEKCDDPVDPMELSTAIATLPDPPSPSLLDGLCEKEASVSDRSVESSESESILHISAFGAPSRIENEIPESPPQEDDGDESEEIEF